MPRSWPAVAERLDAMLNDAARTEPPYLDFLDSVLRQEVDAKQRTRVTMALKIAHFPSVKTLDDCDFSFSRRSTSAWSHLAIALGGAVVEAGHSVLFTSATALLAALAKAESEGQLADRLLFYSKPKLLLIDELGYLPFERRSAHLFFQLVARRYKRGRRHFRPYIAMSVGIPCSPSVTGRSRVAGLKVAQWAARYSPSARTIHDALTSAL